MKALVLEDYKRLVFKEVPTPAPADGEVLVAVKACGICGSDVHGMDGSTGRRRPPVIMGHEAAGIVAGIGKNVQGWQEGDRVTFDSTIYCGECEFCRRGEINLCEKRRVLGVSCEDYRQDGAFAEFVRVPQRVLYRLPEKLKFEEAALVEPFAIALHAVYRAGIQVSRVAAEVTRLKFSESKAGAEKLEPRHLGCYGDSSVAVIGVGMIGLAIVQVLRQAGWNRIIALDVSPERLALAKSTGASHIIDSSKTDAAKGISEITNGDGVNASFEAVGITPTVNLSLGCVRRGGSVVLVGNVAPKIEFPLQIAVTRELSVYGSCASRGEYPKCLDLLSRGDLKAGPLISAARPLSEGAEWFDRLYRKDAGLIKVVLQPT